MSGELSTVKQCSETREYLYQKTIVKTSFIGEDEAINTLASAQKKGTAFSGLSAAVPNSMIDSSITEKIQADRTKWTVTYSIYTPKTRPGGGGGHDSTYYTSRDSMIMAQYQFPLYKYLLSNEYAAVRAWENLPANYTTLKTNFGFLSVDASGENETSVYLSSVSEKALKTAKKLAAGIEYVQKSYPIITHVQELSAHEKDSDREKRLNTVDNSSDVPDLIDGYQWLKTQYDWVQTDTSLWTLTESWMGTPNDQPWDKDLYGPEISAIWKFVKADTE